MQVHKHTHVCTKCVLSSLRQKYTNCSSVKLRAFLKPCNIARFLVSRCLDHFKFYVKQLSVEEEEKKKDTINSTCYNRLPSFGIVEADGSNPIVM